MSLLTCRAPIELADVIAVARSGQSSSTPFASVPRICSEYNLYALHRST